MDTAFTMVNAIQKHARHDLGVTLSLPCSTVEFYTNTGKALEIQGCFPKMMDIQGGVSISIIVSLLEDTGKRM